MLCKLLKILIPRRIRKKILSLYNLHLNTFTQKSYSQYGEDILLAQLFKDRNCGFFIDVGAHHPRRFSNTYLLYKKGWRGINIDPNPGSMRSFNRVRPRDINLETGIGLSAETLKYYQFNEPALNTFSPNEAKAKDGKDGYHITAVSPVPVVTLSEVITKWAPEGAVISLLTVDVEGKGLDVLKSFDWNLPNPELILIETETVSIEEELQSPVFKMLMSKKYRLVSRCGKTSFYTAENSCLRV